MLFFNIRHTRFTGSVFGLTRDPSCAVNQGTPMLSPDRTARTMILSLRGSELGKMGRLSLASEWFKSFPS